MKVKLEQTVKWDCAHILSRYSGKCGNLHGHTYHATIALEGEVSEETCMLVDFNDIKAIIDQLDHACIFSCPEWRGVAEDDLLKWCKKYNKKHLVLPSPLRSTAESLSHYLAQKCKELKGVEGVEINVWETDGSRANAIA